LGQAAEIYADSTDVVAATAHDIGARGGLIARVQELDVLDTALAAAVTLN